MPNSFSNRVIMTQINHINDATETALEQQTKIALNALVRTENERRQNHTVEILRSGLVIKIVKPGGDNNKLAKEIDAISELCRKFPDFIVPILSHGDLMGRKYYIMERQKGASLSDIIFSEKYATEEKRRVVSSALDFTFSVINQERRDLKYAAKNYSEIISQEWKSILLMTGGEAFANTSFSLEGMCAGKRIIDLLDYIMGLMENVPALQNDISHQNYHFGNIIKLDNFDMFRLIDPDTSLPKIDPLFGLARFAFSFWHELATEHKHGVRGNRSGKETLLTLLLHEHMTMISSIPAITKMQVYRQICAPEDKGLFEVLLFYCFLRSIRINWENFHSNQTTAQEILAVGCLTFFAHLN